MLVYCSRSAQLLMGVGELANGVRQIDYRYRNSSSRRGTRWGGLVIGTRERWVGIDRQALSIA